MSNFADNIKKEEIERERRNNTNRTMGKFFLGLSTIIFTSTIIATLVDNDFVFEGNYVLKLCGGTVSFFATMIIGYKLTNRK